jgi:hypothetical protein
MFEPYIGLSQGSFNEGVNQGDMESPLSGFRVGYSGTYFMTGLDISFLDASYEAPFLSEAGAEDYRQREISWYLGWHFNRFKIYGSFGASYLKKRNNNPDKRVYYGETVKAGVGLRLAWRLFLNFESWHSVYDEYDEDRALTVKIPSFRTDQSVVNLSLIFRI